LFRFIPSTPLRVDQWVFSEGFDKINQVVAGALLKQAGISFDIAENGCEAIKQLNEQPANTYQLILMDCQMPEMDGYQATKAIRNGDSGKHY
ncbi:response regulator, partial [Psychrobacter sp. CAL346-MNA-CIBAN-0220]|uniref:response regulator n=1 Tax=Psychrobacter sp. CAL346-MNA-CIBAN-0220 TaxID=3140457 RepID=UPI0033176BFD